METDEAVDFCITSSEIWTPHEVLKTEDIRTLGINIILSDISFDSIQEQKVAKGGLWGVINKFCR